MHLIYKKNILPCLKNSVLYNILNKSDEESIIVPAKCYFPLKHFLKNYHFDKTKKAILTNRKRKHKSIPKSIETLNTNISIDIDSLEYEFHKKAKINDNCQSTDNYQSIDGVLPVKKEDGLNSFGANRFGENSTVDSNIINKRKKPENAIIDSVSSDFKKAKIYHNSINDDISQTNDLNIDDLIVSLSSLNVDPLKNTEGNDSLPVCKNNNIEKELPILTKYTFSEILACLRYWIPNEISVEIYDYVFRNPYIIKKEEIFEKFKEFSFMPQIKMVYRISSKLKKKKRIKKEIMEKLTKKGYLSVIKYFHFLNDGYSWGDFTLRIAAKENNFDIFKFAYENGAEINDDIVFYGLYGCNWDKYKRNIPKVSISVIKNNNIEFAKYLKTIGCDLCSRHLTSLAADQNNIEMLDYLLSIKCNITDFAALIAAKNGHLGSLKVMKKWNVNFISINLRYPIIQDHVECLQFLIENGANMNGQCVYNAVKYNAIRCLRFLIKKECKWNHNAYTVAAETNNMGCLKILLENGCKLIRNRCTDYKKCSHIIKNVLTIERAVENGYINMVKFLHKNKFPFSNKICNVAAKYRQLAVLKYLIANDYPWTVKTVNIAVENDDYNTFQYLFNMELKIDIDTYNLVLKKDKDNNIYQLITKLNINKEWLIAQSQSDSYVSFLNQAPKKRIKL